jgi:hypothetical protein
LNRYSAELPGYNNTQAIAAAANARYREIHFDGFEEDSLNFLSICAGSLFRHFPKLVGGVTNSTYSHSGNYSLRVNSGATAATQNFEILLVRPTVDAPVAQPVTESNSPGIGEPTFGMLVDSAYVVSAWVRTNETYALNKLTYQLANETNPRIEVTFKDAVGNTIGLPQKLHPTGPVIDGWQRISKVVTVPSIAGGGTGTVIFELKNGTANTAYFDDFRVQPFRSSMKTYVYDKRSTRLVATLDDENYATFYEYNQEGTLERVKRETERGIMTIQETRTSIRKP